jgi:hypothetical protein
VAATATVIGIEVGQTATANSPEAKLGYNRAELAVVPTNRGSCPPTKEGETPAPCTATSGNGAKDTTDVLMELRYGGGMTTGGSQNVYQRLAVGTVAVKQPGASVMFAKNANGNVDEKAADLALVYSADAKALEAAKKEGVTQYIQSQAHIETIVDKFAGANAKDDAQVNMANLTTSATNAGIDDAYIKGPLSKATTAKALRDELGRSQDRAEILYKHIIK